MLLLVTAHRHQIRLIQQDIRRHQSRIGKQARVDVVGVLGGLILELGHAAQLAKHGVAVQHPAKLGVGGNVGLNEQHVFLRVQTAGDIGRQLDQGVPPQLRRDLPHSDGVHVGHHIVAVILIRQRRPVSDGAQIGTQRQVAGGLDAA